MCIHTFTPSFKKIQVTTRAYSVLSNILLAADITITYMKPVFFSEGNSVDLWQYLETFLNVLFGGRRWYWHLVDRD